MIHTTTDREKECISYQEKKRKAEQFYAPLTEERKQRNREIMARMRFEMEAEGILPKRDVTPFA